MVMQIPLTRGYIAVIDDEDYGLVAGGSWRAIVRSHGRVYALSRKGYMHRLIVGAQPGEDVDHIDRDGLNNRRRNLRRCSRAQNCMNSRRRGAFKGVQHRGTSFQAKIGLNGKRIALGSFPSAIEAAFAYDTAARQMFGEYARLNFPDIHRLHDLLAVANNNATEKRQCIAGNVTPARRGTS